eukprot:363953-Chlamydomonas_euryale.AAC.10
MEILQESGGLPEFAVRQIVSQAIEHMHVLNSSSYEELLITPTFRGCLAAIWVINKPASHSCMNGVMVQVYSHVLALYRSSAFYTAGELGPRHVETGQGTAGEA